MSTSCLQAEMKKENLVYCLMIYWINQTNLQTIKDETLNLLLHTIRELKQLLKNLPIILIK